MEGGGHLLNFKSLAHTIWGEGVLKIFEQKDDQPTHLMNDKDVWRTNPATLDVLTRQGSLVDVKHFPMEFYR